MKTNKLYIFLAIVLVAFSCKDGYLDEIQRVDPGVDETAPQITFGFPAQGSTVKVAELVTTLNIRFNVSDDIEVKSIKVSVDGNEVKTLTEFLDYRKVNVEGLQYPGLANGTHELTIAATDAEGKTTTQSVTFAKEPPYTPMYDGEVFYMSFDTEVGFKEMVTFSDPTVVGTPTFAGLGAVGTNAYKGAENSYLTTPTTAIANEAFSAVMWMKVNDSPDRAGVLVMGPTDPSGVNNNRTSGFRFFRENAGGKQRFKLNVGNGTADSWFDGGAAADVTPNTGEWVNLAFTITASKAVVYIDGEVVSQGALTGLSWAGCDILSIMSGAPRFTEWGHLSDRSILDELRIFEKELSQDEIRTLIDAKYQPMENETFYMTFNDNFNEFFTGTPATVVGTPTFAAGAMSSAYKGAQDSYLTFPTTNLTGVEFSASFWMKVNNSPDRAGILVVGPEDPAPETPGTANNRTKGFRFFRENAGGKQRFKLNVGDGTADHWFDGGANADVDPAANEWVHFAFTITADRAAVYINGEVVSEGDPGGLSWEGCDVLSIMSGAPRFTGWDHKSDQSLMDDLHLFDKALTKAQVQAIMNGE